MTSGVRPRFSRSGAAIPIGPPESNTSAAAHASAPHTPAERNVRFIGRNLPFCAGQSTGPPGHAVYAHREASVYFDWRLFGMTRGVRGRIAVAALIGLAAVPLSMWRLTLTGQAMARAFAGERFEALFGMLALIAGLIVGRAVLQLARDEVANATAAVLKARVRALLYEHILRLGPGHFDQRRTGDAVVAMVDGVEQL